MKTPKDNSLFYQVQGRGEPLLLLRGLGRSSPYWLGFDQELAKYFQVITVDLRGLGQSTRAMAWTDSIADLSGDLSEVLDQLRIPSCHIFALSLGGMVAMDFASRQPNRVRSLLVAGSSTRDSSFFRIDPRAVLRLVSSLRGGRLHQTLASSVLSPRLKKSRVDEVLQSWEIIRAKEGMPWLTLLKQLIAAARFPVPMALNETSVPLLFLVGGSDGFVPAVNSLLLHKRIKGSRYLVLEGAGHEISIGFEKEVASIIRDFIESHSQKKG